MPFKYNALLGLGLDNTIPLDGAGKIPSTFLPSYVDDVEEYNNLAAFPATGETGKIYVAIDTGFVYRWSGSVYVQIGITAAAGSTTQVQFNDAGAFGGDSGLTFNKTTDALSAGGFIPTSSTVPANGIYLPAANSVAVSTGGTGRLFITSAGLVGISTTSPGALLHAAGTIRAGAADTSDAAIQIGASLSGNRNSYLDLVGDTTYSTYGLRVIRNNSGANATSRLLHRGTGNLDLVAQEAASIAFYTTNQERVRIDPSGGLLVGTSSDSGGALLQVNGDRIRVGTAKTPATSGATGTTGEIAWDANYIYVCTATNTWKRSAIATW